MHLVHFTFDMDTGASKKCYRVVLKITDGVSWEISNLCVLIELNYYNTIVTMC